LGEASTLRNQLTQIDEYLAAIERDSARARKEEEGASNDLSRLEKIKTELSGKLAARQLELESLADRRKRIDEEMKERQTRTIAVRQRLEQTRAALSRQKARKDSLEEILSHRAYTTESVKRLFLGLEHGQIEGFKPSGVLADFVEVADTAWEKACEEFLHEELEYVVVNGWSEAERGVELMRAESDGRATFLVHPEASAASPLAPDLSSQPGIVGRLRDTLRLTNGFAQAPQGLLPRLARCFLVSDRGAAQSLATANPDCYFLLQDGVSYHGHAVSGGRKSVGGPLALKRELRELSGQVEARQREADDAAAELEELERGTARLAEDLEILRTQQQAQEKDALALDHEQRKLAEENARAGSRLSVARLEMERLGREDQRSRAQREQSQALVAEKEQARFDQENLWSWRAANSTSCRPTRIASARNMPRCAPPWRAWKSARGPRRLRSRGWRRSSGSSPPGARNWRASWSGWASNGPGCSPIISSSISAPGSFLRKPPQPRRRWKGWRRRRHRDEPRWPRSTIRSRRCASKRRPRSRPGPRSSWSW